MRFFRGVARIGFGATTIAVTQSLLALVISAALGGWFWSNTPAIASIGAHGLMRVSAGLVWLMGVVTAIDVGVQHRWDQSLDTSKDR
jgi:hypothetical protein